MPKRSPNLTVEEAWKIALKHMKKEHLATSSFRAAFDEFVRHRYEKPPDGVDSPLTTRAVKLAIAKLEKWTHDEAIESLNRTCESGWTGLFAPDRIEAKDRRSTSASREYDEDHVSPIL